MSARDADDDEGIRVNVLWHRWMVIPGGGGGAQANAHCRLKVLSQLHFLFLTTLYRIPSNSSRSEAINIIATPRRGVLISFHGV